MNPREFLALAPLIVLCLWIGVRPTGLIKTIEPDIRAVAELLEKQKELLKVAVVQNNSNLQNNNAPISIP